MEETYKFDAIRRVIEDNRAYSNPTQLRRTTESAPFVVLEPYGSTASMDRTLAAPDLEEGDDRLVRAAEEVAGDLLDTLIEEGELQEVEQERTLTNVKRDSAYVTLEQAIQFWLSYQNKGVDITKVSDVKGNARGFYNAAHLRIIMKGVGLAVGAKASKPALAREIKAWHATNETSIEQARNARRDKTNLQVELGDGAIPPPDTENEEVTEDIDEEPATSGVPLAP